MVNNNENKQNLIQLAVVGGFGDHGTKNNLGGFAKNNLPEGFESQFVLFSDIQKKKGGNNFFSVLAKGFTKTILEKLGMSNGDAPIHGLAQAIKDKGITRVIGHSFGGAATVQTAELLAKDGSPLDMVVIESSPSSPIGIIKSRASSIERHMITDNVMKDANLNWNLEDAVISLLQKGTKVIITRREGDNTIPEEEQLFTKLMKSPKVLSQVPDKLLSNLRLISLELDPRKKECYSEDTIKQLIRLKVNEALEKKGVTKIQKFNEVFDKAFSKAYSQYIGNSHHWPLSDFVIKEEHDLSRSTEESVSAIGQNFEKRVLHDFKNAKEVPKQVNANASKTLIDNTYPPARTEETFECSDQQINGYFLLKTFEKTLQGLKEKGFKEKMDDKGSPIKHPSAEEFGSEWKAKADSIAPPRAGTSEVEVSSHSQQAQVR